MSSLHAVTATVHAGHGLGRRDTMLTAPTTATDNRADTPVVEVMTLVDGLVVRLAGVFRTVEAGLLKDALLRPRPAACRDVLVDAGGVAGIDDESLSVLAAASHWASDTGGRLSFTRRARTRSRTPRTGSAYSMSCRCSAHPAHARTDRQGRSVGPCVRSS